MKKYIMLVVFVLLSLTSLALAQDTERKSELEETIRGFSNCSTVDGGGWEAYKSFLHEDFTRWTIGPPILGKEAIVASIKEWWEAGNRVSEDSSLIVQMDIFENIGIVRIERFESFIDGAGEETGKFHGYLSQLWTYENEKWKLLSLDITPAQE